MSSKRFLSKEEHTKYLKKYDIHPGRAMFTIILSIIVDVFGYSMVLPLLPSIAKTFGASDLFVGVIISSNALSALIFAPIWGKLSDKYGRKPILIIAQAGTGVSFLILALSNSIYIIIFARVLDGVFGGQIPVIRAYISDITTPKTRSSEIGKLMVGHTMGMIFGPIIGGLLGDLNWRYPAILASSLSIVAILLTWKVLIESMPRERRKDLKIQMINNMSDSNEKRSIWSKEIYIRFLQIFLLFSITVMLNSSFPLILDKRFAAEPSIIGSVMTVAGIAVMIYGGILMKPLFRKVGERRVLFFSIILLIVDFIILPYITELWMIYIFIFPFTFCMAFLPPLIQTNITKAVDPDQQGAISGWTTNIQSISQISSPLLATGYLELGGLTFGLIFLNSYHLIGFTGALLGVLLLIIGLIDVQRHPYLYNHESQEDTIN